MLALLITNIAVPYLGIEEIHSAERADMASSFIMWGRVGRVGRVGMIGMYVGISTTPFYRRVKSGDAYMTYPPS
jgi:hypothetical protein